MKANKYAIMAAAGFALALARPCVADQTVVTPVPQNGAHTAPPAACVPQGYVWDGSEYVGQVGAKYYYLGPRNTWVTLDTTRQGRFQQWQQNNPNWQQKEIRNTDYLGHDQGQSQSVAPAPNEQPADTSADDTHSTRYLGHDQGQGGMTPPAPQPAPSAGQDQNNPPQR